MVVARAVGVAADTVRRGRAELDDPTPMGVSGRSGGRRKCAETHNPVLVSALESLIDSEAHEDSMLPLRRPRKNAAHQVDAGGRPRGGPAWRKFG